MHYAYFYTSNYLYCYLPSSCLTRLQVRLGVRSKCWPKTCGPGWRRENRPLRNYSYWMRSQGKWKFVYMDDYLTNECMNDERKLSSQFLIFICSLAAARSQAVWAVRDLPSWYNTPSHADAQLILSWCQKYEDWRQTCCYRVSLVPYVCRLYCVTTICFVNLIKHINYVVNVLIE